jgi:predicted regulator of Ras-like GTPase activity (Roadblock/LC7/MglB family)
MVTRQSELLRVLGLLAEELPNPHWVALVDSDGLVVACVPAEPSINPERISAMTAAFVMTGDRVLEEIEGGQYRYSSIAGSKVQLVTVLLSEDRFLSIGIGPEIPPRTTFSLLSRRVPEIMQALQMRFTTV